MRLDRPRRTKACRGWWPADGRRVPLAGSGPAAARSVHHDQSMEAQRVVDCHVHVFDPQRFPYRPDTFYAPAGQELGTPARLRTVLDAHGVEHALLVGPNSGYGEDNRCLLDTLAAGGGPLPRDGRGRELHPACRARRAAGGGCPGRHGQRGAAGRRVLRRRGRPAGRPRGAGHDRRRPGRRRPAGRARAPAGALRRAGARRPLRHGPIPAPGSAPRGSGSCCGGARRGARS